MHREITYADQHFTHRSNLPLYLFTALLAVLIGADLWPGFAAWLGSRGWQEPWSWDREVFGYRIALIAAILGGARVLYTSLESLFEGRIGADFALAIACIAAILFNKPLVAAEIVFIGMVGECLEAVTFARTQQSLAKIVTVFPRRCWLLRDGQEVRVMASELKPGDVVVVKPGARIPCDGIVRDGRSALDTSALTGESLPRDVGPGDQVLAGSLNQFGALTIETVHAAEKTVVGRVIELTAQALRDKPQLERIADRLARAFLPVVLSLAALTFIAGVLLNRDGGQRSLWDAARRSIDPTLAVLVVACPCALILATPAAVIAALGRLAGTGVLIKGGSALERLATARVFAFDKTGTLTEGRLVLGRILRVSDLGEEEILRLAAAAESRSEHPIAQLIVQECRKRNLPIPDAIEFVAHPGAGVAARTSDGSVLVGNRRLLVEKGVDLSSDSDRLLVQLDAAGETPLLVARDGKLVGVIGARDAVRADATDVVQQLRGLDIEVCLLTGDRQAPTAAVATAIAIQEFHAELWPAEKAEKIRQKQQSLAAATTVSSWRGILKPIATVLFPSRTAAVVMVGDGVNDAPALASADVGIAVGGAGADIAAEAGSIVLMGDPLRNLPLLVRLSRESVHIIQQNILYFAFIVNLVGIVGTAWLWPIFAPPAWLEEAPIAAVIYHQFGSLAVLLNSMRLLWFERKTSSRIWLRLRDMLRSIDAWMARRLDPDEGLHWVEHHWKQLSATAAALALAVYCGSGFVQIGPGEVGLVRRFGKPLADDLSPGLHWCWPWPIERVDRIETDRVQSAPVGFRLTVAGAPKSGNSGLWSIEHRGQVRLMPDEAIMITGDGNLVEIQATVRFRIAEPRVFLFEVGDHEIVLRATTEAVLRETMAGRSFAELLTVGRSELEQRVAQLLTRRCRTLGVHGLGIAVDGVSLTDVHPPLEVVQAYHEVAQAMENRDRTINEAKSVAIRREREAEAEAVSVIRRAEAEKNEKILQAEADKEVFLGRLQARSSLTAEQECLAAGYAVLAMTRGATAFEVQNTLARHREKLAQMQATLTDFRLFWNVLSRTLSGREKIIVDAEKLPGRRQLLLVDPEMLRVPTIGVDRQPATRPPIRRDPSDDQ